VFYYSTNPTFDTETVKTILSGKQKCFDVESSTVHPLELVNASEILDAIRLESVGGDMKIAIALTAPPT
jgi:hypothetical protein